MGSAGPGGANGPGVSGLGELSAGGSQAIVISSDTLVDEDNDTAQDLYLRSGSTTTLLTGGTQNLDAKFIGLSTDATRITFYTDEALLPGDTDTQRDIYQWSGGALTLLSTTATGGNGSFQTNGAVSPDGTTAYLTTADPLLPADTDAEQDVYVRSGGTTSLASTGPTGVTAACPGCSGSTAAATSWAPRPRTTPSASTSPTTSD